MKREYDNYTKRSKRSMEIRNKSSQNLKLKSWSQYLAMSKVSSFSIFHPYSPSPRNEYPILG